MKLNTDLLKFLCCPKCKGTLDLNFFAKNGDEIIEGMLECACGMSYPVIRGVPRMLLDLPKEVKRTQESFKKEWGLHKYNTTKTWGLEVEEKKVLFLEQMGISNPSILQDKVLLDAGCGNGELSISLVGYGLKVVAMDLSGSVVRAYEHSNSNSVYFVQGDVTNPPFREGIFDYVYSEGVLHHTPDTKKAFMSLSKLVKKGGRYWVWLYLKFKHINKNKLALYLYDYLNNVVSRVPMKLQDFILYCLLPVAMIKQELGTTLGNKQKDTWREKLILLHDGFTPRYAHRHIPKEVEGWFEELGFENVTVSDTRETSGFGIYGDNQ